MKISLLTLCRCLLCLGLIVVENDQTSRCRSLLLLHATDHSAVEIYFDKNWKNEFFKHYA